MSRAARTALPIAALYLAAVVLYALLGSRQALPIVSPDEFTYGHVARSLADGDGMTWRGEPVGLRAALYVFVITPAWLAGDTLTAYDLTKLLGALLLCATAVPVWLLARTLMRPATALLVAALALAGTWMTTSALILTENLALPLATAALLACVTALRQPGSRWVWAAIGLAVLAAWARFQLVALLPVIALALAADVARAPAGARGAVARAHRPALSALGALLGAGLLLALADFTGATGAYAGTRDFTLLSGAVARMTGRTWLALFAMAGFVPLVVLVSLATSAPAWRDPRSGPLLALLVPATAVFVALAGWATAGFQVGWPIQRYAEYVIGPLVVLLGVAAERPALVPRRAWVVAGLLAAAALGGTAATPLETRAADGVQTGMRELLGTSPQAGLALAALACGLAGVALLRLPGRGRWAIGLVLLVCALQAQAGWRWQLGRADEWRAGFPADLRAVDHAARGPVARVFLTTSHPRWETVDLFNREIAQEFVPRDEPGNGRTLHGRNCRWRVLGSGVARYEPGCGAPPSQIYLDDPAAVVTYSGQSDVRRIRGLGRVVRVPGPPAPTHVRSIAVLPCDDPTLVLPSGRVLGFAPRRCRVAFTAILWLPAPATLAIAVRGGRDDHVATIGSHVFRLPARRTTTIRVLAPRGRSRVDLRFDRQELPAGLPDVTAATLTGPGGSRSIL